MKSSQTFTRPLIIALKALHICELLALWWAPWGCAYIDDFFVTFFKRWVLKQAWTLDTIRWRNWWWNWWSLDWTVCLLLLYVLFLTGQINSGTTHAAKLFAYSPVYVNTDLNHIYWHDQDQVLLREIYLWSKPNCPCTKAAWIH